MNYVKHKKDQISVAFGLPENYIDWATASSWRILLPNFAVLGGGGRIICGAVPKVVILVSFRPELLIYPHEAEWAPLQTHHIF
jgi:hypothetical protein